MSRASVKYGEVTKRDAAKCRVRVRFADLGIESPWLAVLVSASFGDQEYRMPEPKTQVVALMDDRLETGVVLGAIYSDAQPPPLDDARWWAKRFKDGTFLRYDKTGHQLEARIVGGGATIHADGKLEVKAGSLAAEIAGDAEVAAEGVARVAAREVEAQAVERLAAVSGGEASVSAGGDLFAGTNGALTALAAAGASLTTPGPVSVGAGGPVNLTSAVGVNFLAPAAALPAATTIPGGGSMVMQGAFTETVQGSKTRTVQGAETETIQGARTSAVQGPSKSTATGPMSLEAPVINLRGRVLVNGKPVVAG